MFVNTHVCNNSHAKNPNQEHVPGLPLLTNIASLNNLDNEQLNSYILHYAIPQSADNGLDPESESVTVKRLAVANAIGLDRDMTRIFDLVK